MQWKNDKIKWSPRVSKDKLKRLYNEDALGMIDDVLIDDVGIMLWLRYRDIMYIHDSQHGIKWQCPRCRAEEKHSYMENPDGAEFVSADTPRRCSLCGLSMSWDEFRKSRKRQQLNPGGAVDFFNEYVTKWIGLKDNKEKMLAIDKLIHSFHYSLKSSPDIPTRAAGVNLIEGKLTDVMVFLDEMTFGRDDENSRNWIQESLKMRELWKQWSNRRVTKKDL